MATLAAGQRPKTTLPKKKKRKKENLFKLNSEKTVKSLSRVRLFATPWTVAYQAPLSMGFSRQYENAT